MRQGFHMKTIISFCHKSCVRGRKIEVCCLLDIKKGRLYNMVGRTYALFGIMMEQKR